MYRLMCSVAMVGVENQPDIGNTGKCQMRAPEVCVPCIPASPGTRGVCGHARGGDGTRLLVFFLGMHVEHMIRPAPIAHLLVAQFTHRRAVGTQRPPATNACLRAVVAQRILMVTLDTRMRRVDWHYRVAETTLCPALALVPILAILAHMCFAEPAALSAVRTNVVPVSAVYARKPAATEIAAQVPNAASLAA